MIRQPKYRWARQDAEGPDLDPLLDSTRIIALAQRLAAEIVNGRNEQVAGSETLTVRLSP